MRLLAAMLLLSAVTASPGDILHLRDGSRHYGDVISQNDDTIVFRVVSGDGSASVVRTFAADGVARVERTGRVQAPPTPPPAAPIATAVAEDCEQMLREAFELLDDHDERAALRALQRAVLRAPQAALADLDRQCRQARGLPLDVLLAETRVYVAGLAKRGPAFRLTYATPYELDALGRVLTRQAQERLRRRHDGRSVAEWVSNRSEYTELRPGARALVADASRAAALIATRLRHDPALKDAREERVRLLHLQADLSRLAAQVSAIPGFTAPTEADEIHQPAAASQPASTIPEEEPGHPPPTRGSHAEPTEAGASQD